MESGAIRSAPRIARLDHIVLTVASIDKTVGFYTSVLGMAEVVFGNGRHGLSFGQQKRNLHEAGHEFEPNAARPTPGSADICLIVDADTNTIATWLQARGVSVEEGPVARTGARTDHVVLLPRSRRQPRRVGNLCKGLAIGYDLRPVAGHQPFTTWLAQPAALARFRAGRPALFFLVALGLGAKARRTASATLSLSFRSSGGPLSSRR